ncbi:MAG: ABC-2 transporter permease [Eubacterium sp.]|nr:ABC-2 transporter permease [Eubacterium sp.]
MKGLLIKDFMLVKKHCFLTILISIGFFAMSLLSKISMVFLYYSITIVSIISMTTIAYDETYKWNKYELILPISRKTVVSEKYLFSLILVLPMIIIEAIIYLLVSGLPITDIFSLMSMMLLCGVILPIVVLPIVFKFGYIKGRIVNMIIIALIAASISAISGKNMLNGALLEGAFIPLKNAVLFAVISVILMIVSFLISVKVYQKREL